LTREVGQEHYKKVGLPAGDMKGLRHGIGKQESYSTA